jgi:MFS family permease
MIAPGPGESLLYYKERSLSLLFQDYPQHRKPQMACIPWPTRGNEANRRRLFISVSLGIFAQWSGNGVVSYYLALVLQTVGITSVTHRALISGCLQIWNLFFAVAAAVAVDRVGRRKLFMASGIVMFISYVIITGLSGSFAQRGNSGTGVAVIPFLFIYFAGYDIAL